MTFTEYRLIIECLRFGFVVPLILRKESLSVPVTFSSDSGLNLAREAGQSIEDLTFSLLKRSSCIFEDF